MRLLLDAHAMIWWDSDSSRLSSVALAACLDPANSLVLSLATIWEMQIKSQLGKLTLSAPLSQLVDDHVAAGALELLPVNPEHVYEVGSLPPLHRDPFDRMLVARARRESLTIVTCDPLVAAYAVPALW